MHSTYTSLPVKVGLFTMYMLKTQEIFQQSYGLLHLDFPFLLKEKKRSEILLI